MKHDMADMMHEALYLGMAQVWWICGNAFRCDNVAIGM